MKKLICFVVGIIISPSLWAGESIYCRDKSTPDNSVLAIHYVQYEFRAGGIGRENLIRRDLSSGKLTLLNSDVKKISKTDDGETIVISSGTETVVIARESNGDLFRRVIFQSCSNHPPFTCQRKLQRFGCGTDLNDLESLEYPASEEIE